MPLGALVFDRPENTNVVENVEFFPVKFRRILFSGFRSRKEVEDVSANERPECYLCPPPPQKKNNFVEDTVFLLPVKFRQNLVSGFREEVENVSANQRLARSSLFSDRPENHKLGRRHLILDSCKESLNSVQQFHKRGRK